MRRAWGFLGLVVAVATLGVAACSSSSKNDDIGLPGRTDKDAAPEADSATPLDCANRAGKVSDNPTCDTCAKANCCEEITACDKSADCAELQKCVAACADGDTSCALTCQVLHDKGNDLLSEVAACAQGKCKQQCPVQLPDGGGDAPF